MDNDYNCCNTTEQPNNSYLDSDSKGIVNVDTLETQPKDSLLVLPNQEGSKSREAVSTKITIPISHGCIQAGVFNLKLPILVDTGASISCVRERLVKSLAVNHDIQFVRIKKRVFLADGTVHHIRKKAVLPISIGGKVFSFPFAIMPELTQPMIMGTDFMKLTKATITFDQDPTPELQPVRAVRSVTIPPYSERALLCQINTTEAMHGKMGTLENMQRPFWSPYLVQRSLVAPNEFNRHPVVLLNTTSKPLRIWKDEIVALFDEVQESDIEPNFGSEDSIIDTNTEQVDSDSYTFDSSDDSDMSDYPDTDMSDSELYEQVNHISSRAHDVEIDASPNDPPKCVLDDDGKKRLNDLLQRYDDIFVGKDGKLGVTHLYEHSIHLKEDAVPGHFLPFRQTPEKNQQIKGICEDLVKQGVLRECAEGPWASRSFLVKKASGGQRLVTDYRYLNSQIINQALPTARADDSLEMIGSLAPTIFSKLDAQQGFHQIPIRKEDQHKTAFIAGDKKYAYKALPMGLSTAPAGFCHLVTLILQKLKYKSAIPYLDDILVLSKNVEEHFRDLEEVFQSLRAGKLKLKKTKCEYFTDRIDFLGMRVTPKGLQPSPEKVEAIRTFPRPKSVKNVRAFTGLCQYFKKFIKGYAKLARPLYDLQSTKRVFKWTDEAEEAFKILKHSLCNDALLRYPNFERKFHLATDASNISLGAVLSQEDDKGVLRPVAFAGRTLSKHEKNYNTTERELLAVVYGVLHFRHYLENRHFKLYTDHAALVPLLTKRDLKNRWARWALDIQQFSFTIEHCKGSSNIPPDIMSRREYDNEDSMTAPPPTAQKIKVASRLKFNKKNETVKFQQDDTPNSITPAKTALKGILKQSTHHVYCDCEDKWVEIHPDNEFVALESSILGTNKRMIKPTKKEPSPQTEDDVDTVTAITRQQLRTGQQDSVDEPAVTVTAKPAPKQKMVAPKQIKKLPNRRRPPVNADKLPTKEVVQEQISEMEELLRQIPDDSISHALIKREQRSSPELQVLITYLEKGQLPNSKKEARELKREAEAYTMFGNILMHLEPKLWKAMGYIPMQVVVPDSWKIPILKHFHDSPLAGHMSYTRTLSALMPRFYWKGMSMDVRQYIGTCHQCLTAKRGVNMPKTPMTIREHVTAPFRSYNLDMIGPLPVTADGNAYAHVCIDYATRMAIAFPVKDAKAATAAKGFYKEVISRHGVPKTLQTDNGSCYSGKEFTKCMADFKIDQKFSSAYRPSSNGLVERFNGTIGNCLRTFADKKPKTWDIYLPAITFALNNTVSQTMGYSPFFLAYGQNPSTSVEAAILPEDTKPVIQHVTDMIMSQDHARQEAEKSILKQQKKRKERYDKAVKGSNIEITDIVYMDIPRFLHTSESKKLQPLFMGPYLVVERSRTAAKLRNLKTGLLLAKSVHIDRLKKVMEVRKNEHLYRTIAHNDKLLPKLWDFQENELRVQKEALQTRNIIQNRPAHTKHRKRSRKGVKTVRK